MRRAGRGFSFIEIMAAIGLIGIVIVPLYRMMIVGKRGVLLSQKYLLVTNMAREKIEELKVVPFANIRSDFDNFSIIYKDAMINEFTDADKIPSRFYKVFSDVWTEADRDRYEKVYEKFVRQYYEVYGQNYIIYPKDYEKYKRLVLVEEEYSENKKLQKKVSVHIYLREKDDAPVFTLSSYFIE